MTLKVLATPLRNIQPTLFEPDIDKTKQKQKKVLTAKRSRHEKLEALGQRLRLGILRRVGHRRNRSS